MTWETLTAPDVRGVQEECAQVLERYGDVDIGSVACLLKICVGSVYIEVDAVAMQVL